jgi:hypothetical protein
MEMAQGLMHAKENRLIGTQHNGEPSLKAESPVSACLHHPLGFTVCAGDPSYTYSGNQIGKPLYCGIGFRWRQGGPDDCFIRRFPFPCIINRTAGHER